MLQQSIPTNTCPVCGGKSLVFNKYIGNSRTLPRLFRCPNCDTELNGKPTWKILWALPVCLISGEIGFRILDWLDRTIHSAITAQAYIANTLLIIFGGALFLGICALSFKMIFMGTRFFEPDNCLTGYPNEDHTQQ